MRYLILAAVAASVALAACGSKPVATTSTTSNAPTRTTTTTTTSSTNQCADTPQPSGASALYVAPDAACTPGKWIDADGVGKDSAHSVCGKSYNPRPPLAVTSKLKLQALAEYGLARSQGGRVESDHRDPVWLGGATVLANLWPEPNYAKPPDTYTHNPKDALEFKVYRLTCQSHKLTIAQARQLFEGDWRTAYQHYVGALK